MRDYIKKDAIYHCGDQSFRALYEGKLKFGSGLIDVVIYKDIYGEVLVMEKTQFFNTHSII